MNICRHESPTMRRAYGLPAGPFCDACWAREVMYLEELRRDDAGIFEREEVDLGDGAPDED